MAMQAFWTPDSACFAMITGRQCENIAP
jgi:hypothetical protein